MWGPPRLRSGSSPVFHITIPLARIIRSHGLSYHLYADDTQLYIELCLDKNTSHTADNNRVQRCVANIREWMKNNMLILNDDKTELLLCHPKVQTLLISLKV